MAQLVTDACAYGQLDVVVNGAGRFSGAPLTELTAEDWDAIFAVSVRGPMLMAREAAVIWRRQAPVGAW